MKNKNSFIVPIIVTVVVGAIAFYGGMQYQKSQRGTFANGQFAGRFGGANGGRFGNGTNRPVTGQIISSDANSITIKMPDGSSKIVILSDKTTINKASQGSKSDLTSGTQVAAFGTTNSDGSMTAQVVSIGNGMFRAFGGPRPTGQ